MSNPSVSSSTMMSLRQYFTYNVTYNGTYNLTDEWGWFVDIETNQKKKYGSKPKKTIHTMPAIKEAPSIKKMSSTQNLQMIEEPKDNNLMLCFSSLCVITIIVFYYDYF
jgi:hypothetical protein